MAIITIEDLKGANLDLSDLAEEDGLAGLIREAELFDLRKSMDSSSFYSTFMIETAKDPIADEYVKMLDPYVYEYDGNTYRHEGIKLVLVYYTYARFVKAGTVKSSPVGLVTKSGTYAVAAQQPKLNEFVDQYRQQANILWLDVEFYLENMVPAYTKRTENIDDSSTFKIKKVAGPTPSFDEYLYFRGYNNY